MGDPSPASAATRPGQNSSGAAATSTRFVAARPWITLVARVALAAILGFAGWTKLSPTAVTSVKAYRLFPDSVATVIGHGQPFLELALALLLLVGLASRFVAIVTGVLMVIFIAGIASAWARGLTIDCGCFSAGGTVSAGQTHYLREILRDVGFIVIASWIALYPTGRLSLDSALGLGSGEGNVVEGK